jgi:hypothetical protein
VSTLVIFRRAVKGTSATWIRRWSCDAFDEFDDFLRTMSEGVLCYRSGLRAIVVRPHSSSAGLSGRGCSTSPHHDLAILSKQRVQIMRASGWQKSSVSFILLKETARIALPRVRFKATV